MDEEIETLFKYLHGTQREKYKREQKQIEDFENRKKFAFRKKYELLKTSNIKQSRLDLFEQENSQLSNQKRKFEEEEFKSDNKEINDIDSSLIPQPAKRRKLNNGSPLNLATSPRAAETMTAHTSGASGASYLSNDTMNSSNTMNSMNTMRFESSFPRIEDVFDDCTYSYESSDISDDDDAVDISDLKNKFGWRQASVEDSIKYASDTTDSSDDDDDDDDENMNVTTSGSRNDGDIDIEILDGKQNDNNRKKEKKKRKRGKHNKDELEFAEWCKFRHFSDDINLSVNFSIENDLLKNSKYSNMKEYGNNYCKKATKEYKEWKIEYKKRNDFLYVKKQYKRAKMELQKHNNNNNNNGQKEEKEDGIRKGGNNDNNNSGDDCDTLTLNQCHELIATYSEWKSMYGEAKLRYRKWTCFEISNDQQFYEQTIRIGDEMKTPQWALFEIESLLPMLSNLVYTVISHVSTAHSSFAFHWLLRLNPQSAFTSVSPRIDTSFFSRLYTVILRLSRVYAHRFVNDERNNNSQGAAFNQICDFGTNYKATQNKSIHCENKNIIDNNTLNVTSSQREYTFITLQTVGSANSVKNHFKHSHLTDKHQSVTKSIITLFQGLLAIANSTIAEELRRILVNSVETLIDLAVAFPKLDILQAYFDTVVYKTPTRSSKQHAFTSKVNLYFDVVLGYLSQRFLNETKISEYYYMYNTNSSIKQEKKTQQIESQATISRNQEMNSLDQFYNDKNRTNTASIQFIEKIFLV